MDLNPAPRPALLALVEPDMRGDPMSPLRWTTKSPRGLAAELTRAGHRVCAYTVAALPREEGFSLQGNAKTIEGAQHLDRDAQLRYINERAREFQVAGDPVISVDTKKMEQVGTYKNAGREWHREGKPPRVRTHDFLDRELGKAVPYGIYDLAANAGWVNVGTIRVLITKDTLDGMREPIAGLKPGTDGRGKKGECAGHRPHHPTDDGVRDQMGRP